MTQEKRNQAIDLMARGMPVYKVAREIGESVTDIAAVKERWSGLIIARERELRAQRMDGTPFIAEAAPVGAFLLMDARGRIRSGHQEDVIRLRGNWTPEAEARLCEALNRLTPRDLEEFAEQLKGW